MAPAHTRPATIRSAYVPGTLQSVQTEQELRKKVEQENQGPQATNDPMDRAQEVGGSSIGVSSSSPPPSCAHGHYDPHPPCTPTFAFWACALQDQAIIQALTKERPYLQFLSEKAVTVIDDTFLGIKEQLTAPDPSEYRRRMKEGESSGHEPSTTW